MLAKMFPIYAGSPLPVWMRKLFRLTKLNSNVAVHAQVPFLRGIVKAVQLLWTESNSWNILVNKKIYIHIS